MSISRTILAAAAILSLTTTATATVARADEAVADANGSVTLEWTAPGDDSLTGRATRYDLRYRLSTFTPTQWGAATPVTGVPAPSPSGTRERFTVTGLTAGVMYFFALKTVDDANNWSGMSNIISKTASGTVGVDGAAGVAQFAAPYPNPARQTATFSMNVPQESDVEVEAFDIAGRHVATIAKGRRPPGGENLVWRLQGDDGRRLSAGVYLVRARIGATSFTRRVIVAG